MNLRYIHYKSKMQVYKNLYIWLSNVKEQDNLRLGIIFKPIEKKEAGDRKYTRRKQLHKGVRQHKKFKAKTHTVSSICCSLVDLSSHEPVQVRRCAMQ